MKTRFLHPALYSLAVYFTCIFPVCGSFTPSTGNGIHLCGYGENTADNRRYARSLAFFNSGTLRTVRLIYFLPADRQPRLGIEEKIEALIKDVRKFYGDQMQAHGYGRKTFNLESDHNGAAIVHRVNGQFPDKYYYGDYREVFSKIEREIQNRFDTRQNIYFAVVDVGNERIGSVAGAGATNGDWGGLAAIPASGRYFNHPLAAHELGHSFGLDHDFRSTEHVMSYGPWNWKRTTKLSECTAKWLEIQRYFNPETQLRPWNFPTIDLISPRRYAVGSTSVPIQLKVNDHEGIHQVLLLGFGNNVSACHEFADKLNPIVKFDYGGVFMHTGINTAFVSLAHHAVHPIRLRVVDTDGNVTHTHFNLFPETLQSLTKIAGDNPPPGLPNSQLPVSLEVELRNVNDGYPYKDVWVSFSVTAGGGRVSDTGNLTDKFGRAETDFILGPHRGKNTVEVSALGHTTTFNAMAGSPVNLPDSRLRAAVEKTLKRVSGTPISEADMATLTETVRGPWSSGISDLTGLEFAFNFMHLDLSENSISDISPLENLSRLKRLSLRSNSVSDISPLASLSDLWLLQLANNSISDVAALANLTALARLSLRNNAISDISAVRDLINMELLYLENNDIKDVSALTGLSGLKVVRLTDNKISDLSPLIENQGLVDETKIYVRENPLSYPSIHVHIPALQERGVEIYFDNRTPTTLEPISGDDQEGLPGKALAKPFIVEVKDENGSVFEGVPVTFAVTAGGGILAKRTATTDSNGRATDILTLGGNPGTNTVRVNVKSISAPVTFNADGIRVPGALSIISGNNQEGFPGETLSGPLKVEVRDQFDKPLRNVQVTFAVTAGGGTLTSRSKKTDRNGRAESELTLGPDPGTNTVSVTAPGIERSRSFNAEGVRTPEIILRISEDPQEGLSGATLADPLKVEVQDKTGSPLEGVPVTFVVTAGDGTLSAASTETASNGRAESTFTLGLRPGRHLIEASAEGIDATVIFSVAIKRREFILTVPSGTSLIHVPLKVTTVDDVEITMESVGDLYDALGGAERVNHLTTRSSQTNQWHSYLGDMNRGMISDPLLTIDKGVMASMKVPVDLHLFGDELGEDGASAIRLQRGTNLVGVPLRDSRITRVSDLLALEGIRDNVPKITVSVNGKFKVVERAGDDGDVPIAGGQSFIMEAQQEATVSISGDGWGSFSRSLAAPPVALAVSQFQNASPVLCLTGSIVYQAKCREKHVPLSRLGLSVIVKNLTNGKAHTIRATKGDALQSESFGYQLTVVDVDIGRAAQVRDILEVAMQSPDPHLRAEPVRHTVTPTDVKNSRIKLPELFLYEVPTNTALLMNYPNPFNPETWIPYQLARDATVALTIYDTKGKVVRRLEMGYQPAGFYTERGKAAYWDGRNIIGETVATGIYFYQLRTPYFRQLRRMVVLK
ncbi:MAG: Ig-like domain-containing protein [Candidatus Poribacteria bacterium]|nr:Ig-like domain-containing protein [Candidatus Poribacteria bacterium]